MNKFFIFSFFVSCLPFNSLHALADLVVSTANIQQTQIDKGDLLVIQATVKNQGNLTAAANFMFLYISSDRSFSPDEVIGRVAVKQITTNQTQSVTFVCSVPSYLAAGNFYIGFQVDPFDAVLEDNENNYFAATQTVRVSGTTIEGYRIPYPIIFVHGLTDKSPTWDTFADKADATFGWVYGGRLDYCLNPDGYQSTSDGFIRSFVNSANLTEGDYYYVNFDISKNGTLYVGNDGIPFNDDYSNQSAIVKQGWAIKDAIKQVLATTGAENVILVGHSMGGLASREYLQNPTNWQSDGKHHVAKVFTIGTPHGGSNTFDPTAISNLIGYDSRAEAVRDLRHPSSLFSGLYLFGGTETRFTIYHNDDTDCNGVVGNNIVGLNQKVSPKNVSYACIVSNWANNSDGVVGTDRADFNTYLLSQPPALNPYADRFLTTSFHSSIHKDNFSTLVRGLDEPFLYDLAYPIPLNELNYAFITEQAPNNPLAAPNNTIDYDDYKIKVTQAGTLKIDVFNIPVQSFTAYLVNSNYQIIQQLASNGESNLTFSRTVPPGDYYIEFGAVPTPNSYAFPYAFQTIFTPSSGLTANFSTNVQEGCVPLSVNFSNQSVGNPTSYAWTFTGGTPSTSTSANPTVLYSTGGTFPVSLTVQNAQDNHSITRSGFINVKPLPSPDFTFTLLQNDTVAFANRTNTFGQSTTFSWSFGDGNSSTETSPTYKYRNKGAYTVKLAAQNACGIKDKSLPVSVLPNGINEAYGKSTISIFPNPNDGQFSLTIENKDLGNLDMSVYDMLGQSIWQGRFPKTSEKFETRLRLNDIVKGSYVLKINYGSRFEYRKFLVL